jgi:hypothetical protein
VRSRNLENEEAKARYRAVKIQTRWVVTAGKQTKKLAFVYLFSLLLNGRGCKSEFEVTCDECIVEETAVQTERHCRCGTVMGTELKL